MPLLSPSRLFHCLSFIAKAHFFFPTHPWLLLSLHAGPPLSLPAYLRMRSILTALSWTISTLKLTQSLYPPLTQRSICFRPRRLARHRPSALGEIRILFGLLRSLLILIPHFKQYFIVRLPQVPSSRPRSAFSTLSEPKFFV